MPDIENGAQQPRSGRERRTSPLVWALTGLFVVALMAGLMLPMFQSHRDHRPRSQCASNLHKIVLALLNYQTKYGRFPPAYTVDEKGRRTHSWRALILEFLDDHLYAQYDFSRPWNSPGNLSFAKEMKQDGPYRCPNEEIKDSSWTSYVMLVGPTAFSDGPHGRMLKEITEADGTTNTAAVVEMSPSGILWTVPYDLDVTEMSFKINDPDHVSPRSSHAGGINVAFVDGHEQFLIGGEPQDEAFLRAIATINGGEDMSKFDSQ
jgi:prepilin-type processing-associated H-X9-DG protein